MIKILAIISVSMFALFFLHKHNDDSKNTPINKKIFDFMIDKSKNREELRSILESTDNEYICILSPYQETIIEMNEKTRAINECLVKFNHVGSENEWSIVRSRNECGINKIHNNIARLETIDLISPPTEAVHTCGDLDDFLIHKKNTKSVYFENRRIINENTIKK